MDLKNDGVTVSNKILFVINEPGEFVELSRIMESIKKEADMEMAVLFSSGSYVNLGIDRFRARKLGVAAFFPENSFKSPNRHSGQYSIKSSVRSGDLAYSVAHQGLPRASSRRAKLLVTFLSPLFLALFLLDSLFKKKDRPKTTTRLSEFRYASRVFDQYAPNVVIFGQDFPFSINTLLIKKAKVAGAKSVVVPFSLGTTRELCESLSSSDLHDADRSMVSRLVAYLFPDWVNYYKDKKLLRLPPADIIVSEMLSLRTPHPWVPNSSYADVITMESEESRSRALLSGTPDSQLVLTGAPVDDALSAFRRNCRELKGRLLSAHSFANGSATDSANGERLLAVVAWPPDQFGSRLLPLEFRGYEELCQAWAEELAEFQRVGQFTVVVRPHPVTDRIFLAKLLSEYDLSVTLQDTASLVAAADLFVASVSTTIRWAIMCGVPVVNYDVFDYQYNDFDSAEAVLTMSTRKEFARQLHELVEDSSWMDSLRQRQAEVAAHWGVLDDGACDRILSVVRAP